MSFFNKLKLTIALFLISYSLTATAQNLLQVFQDALQNDPTFQQAEAEWETQKQQVPIALSALLPQVNASGNFSENTLHRNVDNSVVADGPFTTQTYSVNLDQQVLNASLWAQLANANATVKAATATYTAAFQDLIVRTTEAYLNVLQNYDALRYTLANKRATYRQLVAEQQKFKVGLVAITDVYDAQSQFDIIVAQEIVARNSLDNSLEQLQAITGQYYLKLSGLGEKGIPLLPPEPHDINAWVQIAREQNYLLIAQQYNTKAAYNNILANAANHLPTVAIQGGYQKTININEPISVNTTLISPTITSNVDEEDANVGVTVNMPLFTGGAVVARTRQARAQYVNQAATLELTHRQVVTNTREAYLGLVSAISQVQADVQAIKSASNSVSSTEEGYKVGTRTIVDLLQALTRLYQTQQQLAVDQYSYINNFIGIKNQAGTLSIKDIRTADEWLNTEIAFKGEYAPTRVRMAEGTFSYTYEHHEIPEELQGTAAPHDETTTISNTSVDTEVPDASSTTTKNIPEVLPQTIPQAIPNSKNNMPSRTVTPSVPINTPTVPSETDPNSTQNSNSGRSSPQPPLPDLQYQSSSTNELNSHAASAEAKSESKSDTSSSTLSSSENIQSIPMPESESSSPTHLPSEITTSSLPTPQNTTQ